MDLSHKTYVVTGATSGIGLATTQALAQAGANVIGIGRSAERCQQAENHLRAAHPEAYVTYLTTDLSVQAAIRQTAGQIAQILESNGLSVLDGLVNNAGVFAYWLTLTPDGVEMQWAVNHMAPFLLTALLLPQLQAAPFARVVTVSSDSHRGARIDWADPQLRHTYNGLRAYSNTKLANILFTAELNRRLGVNARVRAFAADPGLVKTDIGMKGTPSLVRWAWRLRRSGGSRPEVPARGIVYLLGEPALQTAAHWYWKEGQPIPPSRAASDESSAARLWQFSAQLCGIYA